VYYELRPPRQIGCESLFESAVSQSNSSEQTDRQFSLALQQKQKGPVTHVTGPSLLSGTAPTLNVAKYFVSHSQHLNLRIAARA